IAGLKHECESIANTADLASKSEAALSLLIGAGELAQGLLDEQFARYACDDWSELTHWCAQLTLATARVQTDPTAGTELRRVDDLLCDRVGGLPTSVTVKTPEGYAFYALYPEMYSRAAQQLVA